MLFRPARFCATLLALACIAAASPALCAPGAASTLKLLFDEAWEQDLRADPLMASSQGERRYDNLWPDLSPAALARKDAQDVRTLERLHDIDRGQLDADDQLNYDLFDYEYRGRIAAQPFKADLYHLLSSGAGLHTAWEITESLPFAQASDYDSWIARLNSLDRYLEQGTTLMRQAIREKRVPPRVLLDRVTQPLAALTGANIEDNPFYAPFKRMPESISAAERERLAAEGRTAVERKVIPAYRTLNEFFLKEYLPAGGKDAGIWSAPQGDAFYRERIAHYTTTRMTPDEIHALGLKEVARIHEEMEGIIRQVKFTGGFAAFLQFLRTDPQFYYKTPEELFTAYAATAKRIDPELVKLFRKLPRTPYGVRPIPMATAPNTTTAYYMGPAADGSRAGFYYVNLYRPEVRPKYEIEVLTVHEAVPGHHLQISLAREQEGLPAFRRNGGVTAYVEGWGLYSESLGEDLGLYKDPYAKFGQLTYEMWRAVRLVVDTGIHYKHWTRQQAIDYFLANAAKTEADIVNEIDRYIGLPGQALAYKIGQLKLLGLRREAQEKLGPKFDIRDFHDAVLSCGAVPLDILERRIHAWIEAARPAP